MADIRVTEQGEEAFEVEVVEKGTSTTHQVTVSAEEVGSYGVTASALILESFRFLLEREPKESILSTFELSVIGKYFPEYPDEIRRRLDD